MAGNVIGEPFKDYVNEQIKIRQEVHGKTQRTLEEIAYLNSRNAWVKMASGVTLSAKKYNKVTEGIDRPSLGKNQKDDGGLLAKNWVLFNGLGKQSQRDKENPDGTTTSVDYIKGDRAGISGDNKAYGIGGTNFGYSPMPGIVDVNLKCLNRGSIKKVQVNIIANNTNQFNVIDALYLRLGYSVFIEWGYDKYLDKHGELQTMGSSLIDEKFFSSEFNKSNYSKWIPEIETKRRNTNGNYEGIFGTISNFSWTFQDDGSYKIKIEIISLGDIIESLKANLPPLGVITSTVATLSRADRVKKYTDPTFSPNETDFYSLIFPNLESDLRNYYDATIAQYKNPNIVSDWNMEVDLEALNKGGGYYNIVHIINRIGKFDNIEFIKDSSVSKAVPKAINMFGSSEVVIDDKKLVDDNILPAILWALKTSAELYVDSFATWAQVPLRVYKYGYISSIGSNRNPYPLKYPYFNYKGEVGDSLDDKYDKPVINVSKTDGRGTKLLWYELANVVGANPRRFDISLSNSEALDAGNMKNPPSGDKNRKDIKTWGQGEWWYTKIFTFEMFKNLVFSYFQNEELAGGATDPRAPDEPDEPEPEITDDNANLNRITKYFFNIRNWYTKIFKGRGQFVGYTIRLRGEKFGAAMPHTKKESLELWNELVQFPKYKTNVKSHDQIDFLKLDITPSKQSWFIRLQTLLNFIQENIIPKIEGENTPLMTINTSRDDNICYINDNIISTDITKCLVRNSSFYNGNTTEDLFKGIAVFKNTSHGWNYGKTMNIYFNFERVIEIFKEVDNKGDVSLFKVIKNLCNDMNECLGNINNFEPVIKEDNQLRIIDQTPIPGIDEIVSSLKIQKPVKLEVFGYNQTSNNPSKYTSNFVHKIGITTEINKNYATMITIGATSQGSIPGMEATAFSKWNVGIKDRFKNNIVDAVESQPIGTTLNKLKLQNKSVRNEYRDLITTPFFKLGLNLDQTISTDKISTNKTVISNYYKYFQAYTSIEGENSNSSVGFLPFNLKIDMDGLGGIKIYNKLNVNTSFLPSNYPDALDFIITGVDHKISKNQWTTHLNTIASPSQKSTKSIKDPSTNTVLNLPPPGVTAVTAPPSGYTNGEVCSRPATYPDPLTVAGSYDLTTAPDSKYLVQMDKRVALIDKWWDDWKNTSKGYCARYTWNAAKYFHHGLRDPSFKVSTYPKTGFESAGGHAKQKYLHDRLMSELSYKRYHLGSSLTKNELKDTIKKLYVLPGDILVYWDNSNEDGGIENYQVYGHVCMWGGKNKQLSNSDRWISDRKYRAFCYGGMKGDCWQLYFLKAPLIGKNDIYLKPG